MAAIQDICDAIWTYETRTLKTGSQIETPATFLETVCKESWTEAVRTLTVVSEDSIIELPPFQLII
jgi:hypothetical protein